MEKSNRGSDPCPSKISSNLSINRRMLKNLFGESQDVKMREFEFGTSKKFRALVLFIDGMVDKNVVNHQIIEPIMYSDKMTRDFTFEKISSLKDILDSLVAIGEVTEVATLDDAVQGALMGDTVLFVEGQVKCLILGSKGFDKRNVNEPDSEVVIRGPKESFTENLRTNTVLLRRKIKNSELRMIHFTMGKRTKTPVVITYIEGLVKPGIVEEIKRRLKQVEADGILDSGYIEQYIEDAPFSIFPTVGNTEKPDVLAARLLEGRAGVIVDGSPVALTVPFLFIEKFQSAEDYYSRPWFASFIRACRYLAFALCVLTPALYVAFSAFHPGIIPTKLLYTMIAARQGVPFSAFFEAVVMILLFELLREAGLRLPKPVGQTIGIVGALIMGESAVSAGLVSPLLLICVALSAVSGFVVSGLNGVQNILRLIYLVLAATLGGLGVAFGLFFTLLHLSVLKSFGRPYLQPFAPLEPRDLKDSVVRAPLWKMILRPTAFSRNRVRFSNTKNKGDR
ncbi:MAG: spore germination protein [Ruminococcaceae bacterium]|nr:spore germination protein [Oscillospiraceae bacterium]